MIRAGRLSYVWYVCGAVLVGCGGGATAPAKAPSATSPEDPSPAPADEAAAKPTADPPPAEASPAEGASADELSSILQRVIEDGELDQYLKLTLPGRFPLKISGDNLPNGISLTKGNQPVAIVAAPSSKKDAVLVLTAVEINGSDATVTYHYDVEGIRGTARLKKGDRGWELKNSRIVQH